MTQAIVIACVILCAALAAPRAAAEEPPKEYQSFGEWGRAMGKQGKVVGQGVGGFFRSMGERDNWIPPKKELPEAEAPKPARKP